MKWSSILVLGTLAFLVNACEKHPAADLPPEHATAFGDHGWAPGAAPKHGDSHAPAAESHATAPAPAAAAAPAEAPAGESPKFFPEKK